MGADLKTYLQEFTHSFMQRPQLRYFLDLMKRLRKHQSQNRNDIPDWAVFSALTKAVNKISFTVALLDQHVSMDEKLLNITVRNLFSPTQRDHYFAEVTHSQHVDFCLVENQGTYGLMFRFNILNLSAKKKEIGTLEVVCWETGVQEVYHALCYNDPESWFGRTKPTLYTDSIDNFILKVNFTNPDIDWASITSPCLLDCRYTELNPGQEWSTRPTETKKPKAKKSGKKQVKAPSTPPTNFGVSPGSAMEEIPIGTC